MKPYLIITILIITSTSIVFSQFEDFELLDHSDYQAIISKIIHHNNEIIYIVENEDRGRSTTDVMLVRDKFSFPESLLQSQLRYRSKSKSVYNSDGKLRLYLFDLVNVEIDDFSPDYVVVREDSSGNYISTTIHNPGPVFAGGIQSVAIDSAETVYAWTNYSNLQRYRNDVFMDDISLEGTEGILHNNSDGAVYFFDSARDSIFIINDMALKSVSPLNINVKEVKVIDSQNWVLSRDNEIYIYNNDFTSLVTMLDVPIEIISLDQVSEIESQVYILESTIQGHKLYRYENETLDEIADVSEDFASSDHLVMVDDSIYITGGQYVIDEICNQGFIRNYEVGMEFDPIRYDINLDYFDLTYLRDTVISGAPIDDIYLYDVSYAYTNVGNVDITNTSIYTSDLLSSPYGFFTIYRETHASTLQEDEASIIDTTILIIVDHPSESTVAIPGSDYKFNNANTPLPISITTLTKELYGDDLISVFSNPFTNHINYETELNLSRVEAYNSSGQLVKTFALDGSGKLIIDRLESGFYTLIFSDDKSIYTRKLIKMK